MHTAVSGVSKSVSKLYSCCNLQVMALPAYLIKHKNNYGPCRIIVPNAVMICQSELNQWLHGVQCAYYIMNNSISQMLFCVQVMALLAYLMKRNNYGPYLVIVPKAVMLCQSELN